VTRLVQLETRETPSLLRPHLHVMNGGAEPVGRPERVSIRAARLEDVATMFELLDGYARKGLLLPRTIGDVYRNVREFVVAVDEQDRVIGCGGLRVYSPVMGEIIALAVNERCHGLGVGRQIVETLLEQAHAMDMCRVFAMTLQEGFFHKMGFETTHITAFPEKITFDCSRCAKRAQCIEIAVAIDL